jgi:hypothetical protein
MTLFMRIAMYVIFAVNLLTRNARPTGDRDILPPVADDEPQRVEYLRDEFRDEKLDESIYTVFDNAYTFQVTGNLEAARQEYAKLARIQTSDTEWFDLAAVSRTIKRNVTLLDASIAHQNDRRTS